MIWTPEQDRVLLKATEDVEGTWDEVAAVASTELGVAITGDAAGKRHKRILASLATRNSEPAPNEIDVPSVPEGDFVGFNMAYFDIETQSLDAWTGRMTVVSIVDQFGRETTRDRFEFPQDNLHDDSGLAVWARDELEKYDIWVAWYGSQFDLSYINAKLVEHRQRVLRDTMFIDPIYKARGGRYGLKVGSSKLKNVALWLNTPNQKPDVAPRVWGSADIGDKDAIDELRVRCAADCYVMRDIFQHLKPMIRAIHR